MICLCVGGENQVLFGKGVCLLASFGTFGVRETDECSRGKNTFEERIKVRVVSTLFSGIFLDDS